MQATLSAEIYNKANEARKARINTIIRAIGHLAAANPNMVLADFEDALADRIMQTTLASRRKNGQPEVGDLVLVQLENGNEAEGILLTEIPVTMVRILLHDDPVRGRFIKAI